MSAAVGYAAVDLTPHGATAGLAQRLLNLILFVTVLTSSLAFIEPSPHDVLIFVLFAACIAARVPFDRKLVPLLLLLLLWLAGGLFSLMQVGDEQKPIQYAATSIYLALAATMFAGLFSEGDLRRLLIMRRGYVLAALVATAAGYVGFFNLVPGYALFLDNDRVSATFKDPNVYGPFLIYPLLLVLIDVMTRRGIRLGALLIASALMGGLFLSFSRGAWMHFAVSAAVTLVLLLAVAGDRRLRTRIALVGVGAALATVLVVAALLSFSSVHDLFLERASAIQPYDVGPGGRFWLQRLALDQILLHPNGLGPFEFSRIFGGQQHDVYMQGFLVYGWFGGAAYLALVLVTLGLGLRGALMASPSQSYLIAAYAAFVGEAGEGFIVDTDHWRHFFLLLGLVWGLTVASINARRRGLAGAVDDAATPALAS